VPTYAKTFLKKESAKLVEEYYVNNSKFIDIGKTIYPRNFKNDFANSSQNT